MSSILRHLVVSTLLAVIVSFIGFLLEPEWQPPFETQPRTVHANEPIPMIEIAR